MGIFTTKEITRLNDEVKRQMKFSSDYEANATKEIASLKENFSKLEQSLRQELDQKTQLVTELTTKTNEQSRLVYLEF